MNHNLFCPIINCNLFFACSFKYSRWVHPAIFSNRAFFIFLTSIHDFYVTLKLIGVITPSAKLKSLDITGLFRDFCTYYPWHTNSIFIIVIYPHLIIYFVPLPFPSTATTPFSSIAFNNCVVFDLPNGTYGAISLIGFSIVLLKDL